MVDHGCEISSQPVAGRIKVRRFRGSSCWKLQVYDSVITKMAMVHLFHVTGNVSCTVTGEGYASLLEQSVILLLQARQYDTTTMYLCRMLLLHTLPIVWTNCSAAISSKTESSAGNFLQFGLLDSLIWILATFGCGDTSRPWSIVILSHLYLTFKKA